ncbi:MAG: mechanosensitive ion channel family protein [Snowella sp.]|nr:mechanosensitive ion channel family protein [Snowella sp.]
MTIGLQPKRRLKRSKLGRSFLHFCLLSLLTLWLSVGFASTIQAQLPSLPSSDRELFANPRQLSGRIGNLSYAPIKIDGRPLFFIAVPFSIANSEEHKTISPLKERVKRIQNKIQEILKRGFDPQTLQVYPSVLNNQTVILVADQKNFKPQILGTITEPDAELYGQDVDEIAAEITSLLRSGLIRAWEERQPEAFRQQILSALQIFGVMLGMIGVLIILQRFTKKQIQSYKEKLADLDDRLQAGDQSDTPVDNSLSFPRDNMPLNRSQRLRLGMDWLITQLKFHSNSTVPKKREGQKTITQPEILRSPSLPHSAHSPNLEKIQLLLKRKLSFAVFIRRLSVLAQLFILIRGIAFILTVFPHTRNLGFLLAGAPTNLLTIWLGIIFFIKIGELIIDRSLQAWVEDLQLIRKSFTRQNVRIPTIASTLKGINLAFCGIIGIILSLAVFDVPITTVLAGAGILGFAVSFGSQSLIKDLIAGVINLANDAYALGDFVIIGNDSGLVEDMNLFVTRIRSGNGDLITIPNGSVGTVRNQSKDWSRVDYQIQVSYEADIPQALELLTAIAQELYDDPQWNGLILEPPDLKGVEDISYQGVMIRIWLKTKPGEQWIVARELRLRVKAAFEQAGIDIGVPKQAMIWQKSLDAEKKSPLDPS